MTFTEARQKFSKCFRLLERFAAANRQAIRLFEDSGTCIQKIHRRDRGACRGVPGVTVHTSGAADMASLGPDDKPPPESQGRYGKMDSADDQVHAKEGGNQEGIPFIFFDARRAVRHAPPQVTRCRPPGRLP